MEFYFKRCKTSLILFFNFIKILLSRWKQDHISSYAASLAFYSLFSLTPLIIICTALLGLTIGKDIAQTKIIDLVAQLMGSESAQQIHMMILNATKPIQGITAEVLSFLIIFFGASGIFIQVQVGLNTIFSTEIKKTKRGFIKFIRNRFFLFILVLGIASLLFISLIISIILSYLTHYIFSEFTLGIAIIWCLDFFASFVGVTLLFSLLYKLLPEVDLKWSEVLFGSGIAAFLFILGKFLLGFYLGTRHVANSFGPAGALVIILIWLYYSAQILFLGAEMIVIRQKKDLTRN